MRVGTGSRGQFYFLSYGKVEKEGSVAYFYSLPVSCGDGFRQELQCNRQERFMGS